MTPERAQRILHAWPEWDASIMEARNRLRYLPAWRPKEPHDTEALGAFWMGDAPTGPYADWAGAHLDAMDDAANESVRRLLLGDGFWRYWRACFLSDYGPGNLAAIRWDDGSRAFPPSDAFLTVTMNRTAGRPARLEIEGPAALVTAETLREASQRAIEAMRTIWADITPRHPVLDARRRQAGPGRQSGPDPVARLAEARRRWHKATGSTLGPSRAALARQAGVSPSTIGRWIRAASAEEKDLR